MLNVLALCGAFAVVTAMMPRVYGLSVRYNIVDHPNHRKVHEVPMPFVGAALWLGVTLLMWALPIERELAVGLSLGGTIAFGVGFVDDLIKSRGEICPPHRNYWGRYLPPPRSTPPAFRFGFCRTRLREDFSTCLLSYVFGNGSLDGSRH
ncbi:MAG: Undecaprenyl-phosphate alpha-N-acetylglucosaminyl 1-phosphate transferase [Firmicutes bacterium]|nr:Undecaprenyl-phosphate alpha-N-acetylglucosaminyl 1-phosphate transferase [Bacillota bacterium]